MTIDETVRQIEAIAAGLDTYTPTADDADDLRQEIAELTDERDGLAAEIRDAQAQLERLQEAATEAEARLESLQESVDTIRQAIDDALGI